MAEWTATPPRAKDGERRLRRPALRVALTCDWFLKYAAAQAAGLAHAGAEVLLLCRPHTAEFGFDARERDTALGRARGAGVTVVELPGRMSDPRALVRLAAVRRRVLGFGPDVVHAHDGADPRALPVLRGWSTVVTVHDPVPHPGHPGKPLHKRWFLDGGRDAWRARAEALVVHSESLRHELHARPGQRCAVIPHGLEVAARPLPPPARPAVAFFGRLTAYKGLDVLARAMPRVWSERPDVQLHVAGDGPVALDLDDPRLHVERGYLPEQAIQPFLAQASLAVLPYTEASQTGVGSAAIGAGVPVVVTRVGGLPDLALDDSYVVPAGDDAALARAILSHLDDGPRVRARVHGERALPRSWDAVAHRTLELYRQLLR